MIIKTYTCSVNASWPIRRIDLWVTVEGLSLCRSYSEEVTSWGSLQETSDLMYPKPELLRALKLDLREGPSLSHWESFWPVRTHFLSYGLTAGRLLNDGMWTFMIQAAPLLFLLNPSTHDGFTAFWTFFDNLGCLLLLLRLLLLFTHLSMNRCRVDAVKAVQWIPLHLLLPGTPAESKLLFPRPSSSPWTHLSNPPHLHSGSQPLAWRFNY